ncbi:MAG TPA: type II toxin-antitoxin system prevent-host-death family antitoxin [Rhizomicrobium sp.]|nr:type II toxin-antitoxin system prevent-host-death family antitoxin [Rhizomicrobium sp.]
MVRQVDVEKAKSQFARLVASAAKGEDVILTKNGKPMAKLMAVSSAPEKGTRGKRKLGQWAKYLTPAQRKDIGSEEWERRWKGADEEIVRDFECLREEPNKYDPKWPDISSTPMRSSKQSSSRKISARKRAKR